MARRLVLLIFGFTVVGAAPALALPKIAILPPEAARFAPDQRFDLSVVVEAGQGELTKVAVALDGVALPLDATGSLGARFAKVYRQQSFPKPGWGTVSVSATDGDGVEQRAERKFEVVAIEGASPRFKNVIFFLGDGMGAAHRTAARIVRHGYTAGRANGLLAMDKMPASGLVMTSSLNGQVTDSSPGMSCYMTGNKAANNQEGVFPDGADQGTANDGTLAFDNPRVEYLGSFLNRKLGKAIGVVSTADLEDATPAATMIHTAERGYGTGIIDQFFDEGVPKGLAVLMGGGRRWFVPASDPRGYSSRENRSDYALSAAEAAALGVPAGGLDPERNLVDEFERANFRYVESCGGIRPGEPYQAGCPALRGLAADPEARRLLGLFAWGNLNVAYDKIAKRRAPEALGVTDDFGAPDQPLLSEMVRAAITVLERDPEGFLLVAEGAHIDKQSHAMDADRAIWDTIEFDDAIEVARDYAANHPETLVIVTADHECAGFSIVGAATATTTDLASLPSDAGKVAPSANETEMPARQKVVGLYEDSGFPRYEILGDGYPKTADPDKKLLISYGAGADRFEGWLAKPLPVIESLLPKKVVDDLAKGNVPTGRKYPREAIERDEHATGMFLRGVAPDGRPNPIVGGAAAHTATDIVLTADGGPSAEGLRAALQFTGYQDNTDVFFKILRAVFGGY